MKKVLLSAAVCALFMTSCSNESDLMDLSATSNGLMTRAVANDEDFQIVNYDGEPCVQFRNDSTYNVILSKIENMTKDEIINFFAKDGFVCQLQLMDEADKEQEFIVDHYEKNLNQPFPTKEIEAFKQKYGDVFLFNPYDSTDFVANYKISSIFQGFANRQNRYLIGDSLVKCPVYSLYDLFGPAIEMYGKNEATDENSMNKAESKYQIPGGDYVKVRAIPQLVGVDAGGFMAVGFDYLSQKKKVLWKKHHGRIHLRLTAYGSNDWQIYNSTYYKFISYQNKTVMIYAQVYNKSEAEKPGHSLGRVGVSGTSPKYYFRGNMEIWSDEIPESNRGFSKIDRSSN